MNPTDAFKDVVLVLQNHFETCTNKESIGTYNIIILLIDSLHTELSRDCEEYTNWTKNVLPTYKPIEIMEFIEKAKTLNFNENDVMSLYRFMTMNEQE